MSEEVGFSRLLKRNFLPVFEAELHLVKVGGQVPRADLVVAADDSPLEERPDALDRVRVDVGPDVLVGRVVDLLVAGVLVADALVPDPLVRLDRPGLVGDVLADESVERSLAAVADHAEPDFPGAVGDSRDRRVVLVAVALGRRRSAARRRPSRQPPRSRARAADQLSPIAARMRWARYQAVL